MVAGLIQEASLHHHSHHAMMLPALPAAGGQIVVRIGRSGKKRRAQKRANGKQQESCHRAPHWGEVKHGFSYLLNYMVKRKLWRTIRVRQIVAS
jgi:hypothetical protein